MERKEILIDGYFYDVTDFVKRHPGGSVIEYYTKAGEDGTHALQQFHHRSIDRVHNIMKSLKKRPALDSESNIFWWNEIIFIEQGLIERGKIRQLGIDQKCIT